MINLMVEINCGLNDVKKFIDMFEVIGVKTPPGTNGVAMLDEISKTETVVLPVTVPNEPTVKVLENLVGVKRVFSNPKIEPFGPPQPAFDKFGQPRVQFVEPSVSTIDFDRQYIVINEKEADQEKLLQQLKQLRVTLQETQILKMVGMIGLVAIRDEATMALVKNLEGVEDVCKNQTVEMIAPYQHKIGIVN